ncbi:MAG: hypothetical protein O2955_10305 [Planctomycetota bacterium]|nr:hypothetical protein [Planctomycetota bacterium]MDA1212902.1 hypothetical protein [Planctomycetota bacterium]
MNTIVFVCCTSLCGYAEFQPSDPFYGAVSVDGGAFSFESTQDRDFDNIPDDWVRRKGEGFPAYVYAQIDRQRGYDGRQSLRFDVNGGKAVMYSNVIDIDPGFSYVFHGVIRTQRLKNSAAAYTVSFLNHKRQRVQRYVSPVVSGTHQGWVNVRIDTMLPKADVRFAVIGCHLLQGEKLDIQGSVWFDDIWLGRLPQLKLESNFSTRFRERDADVNITSIVSGLDTERQYELQLKMFNNADVLLKEERQRLEMDEPEPAVIDDGSTPAIKKIASEKTNHWKLAPQDYGFYRVESILLRDGDPILTEQSTFAVIDMVHDTSPGEFGWTIAQGINEQRLEELPAAAAQGGINWLKYPLWKSVFDADPLLATNLSQKFESLQYQGISTVGLLDDPPSDIRNQFAENWTGIGEVFSLPSSFWSPSLIQVMARYSSQVHHWQLGGEHDYSFVGISPLPSILENVKHELDRVGRDTLVGMSWNWQSPLPERGTMRNGFLSLSSSADESPEDLKTRLDSTAKSDIPRWVLIRPVDKSTTQTKDDLATRNGDLIKRMLYAKIGGADVIFADDVFNKEHGMMNPDGSPTLLFLPWRTTSLALKGAQFLGSFDLPGGSTNYVFARDDEAVVAIWNDRPTTEVIALGSAAEAYDVWGMKQPLSTLDATQNQEISVTPLPLIIRHCSSPLVRWIMAAHLEKGRLASRTTEQEDALIGVNTFDLGVNGKIRFNVPREINGKPKNWDIIPHDGWTFQIAPGEEYRLPLRLTLPPNTGQGIEDVTVDFDINADVRYVFRVYYRYQVGLGDVTMRVVERVNTVKNQLEVEQIITNNTSPAEVLDFNCSLHIPGERRQKKLVTNLGKGQDRKTFLLPHADALMGKELWLRAEQIGGSRILNYRWMVGDHIEILESDPRNDEEFTNRPATVNNTGTRTLMP